jgi:guanylate kinase
MPPSRDELERRLRSRGDTSDGDVERRLGVADEQILDAREHYDHLVMNEELGSAISRVVSILRAPATSDEDSNAFRVDGDAPTTRSDTE